MMDQGFNDTLRKLEEVNTDLIESIQLIREITAVKNLLIKEREQLQAEINKYITEDY